MEDNVNQYLEQLEAELNAEKLRSKQVYNANQSMFGLPSEDNLIRWQLDLKEDMDKIYHLLKGHQIKEDEQGNIIYETPKNPDMIIFNDYGVDLIMNIMSFFLNRNTLLSNYDEETIKWKALDFGIELSDLIHNKYELMFYIPDDNECIRIFIDRKQKEIENKLLIQKSFFNGNITENDLEPIEYDYEIIVKEIEDLRHEFLFKKIKMYPMIVHELVHCVYSAMLRALNGGERESLRTARSVVQTEHQSPLLSQAAANNSSQRKILWNPFSWGK